MTVSFGEARATYLKFEMKNVQITSHSVGGSVDDGRPVVTYGHNFEEIKVTYTEFDDKGQSKGNVETTWKVEKGEK